MSSQKKNSQERLQQTRALFAYEKSLYDAGASVVVGIDEVGRGALAGPVTAAAVVLGAGWQLLPGLDDSKRLSPRQRTELAALLKGEAGAAQGYHIAHVEAAFIDEQGIMPALRLAMTRALEGLTENLNNSKDSRNSFLGSAPNACCDQLVPDKILIDGHPLKLFPQEEAIVKGDSKIACIAAASVLAKVARDELMVEAAELYPEYDLASNKGYASVRHQQAIAKQGLCSLHRRSFCQNFLQESLF